MARKYLQLFRAHTAPLEAIPATVGALLAVGGYTHTAGLWFIAGVLYHFSGYGMNSYMDWKKGHDKDDPHKQHHPLNDGRLTGDRALIAVGGVFLITLIFVGGLIGVLSVSFERMLLSYGIMSLGIVTGYAYNEYSKSTILKPVPIMVAHTTVFVIPYVSLGGDLTSLSFLLGVLYMLVWVGYQIGVLGELQDMRVDDTNILTDLNIAKYGRENRLYLDTKLIIVSVLAKGLAILIAIRIAAGNGNLVSLVLIAFAGALLGVHLTDLFTMGSNGWEHLINVYADDVDAAVTPIYFIEFDRDKILLLTARIERETAVIFALMYYYIGVETAILLALSMVWVVILNKYLWGTYMAPKV